MKRTNKHRREDRAVELGPIELMELLSWELRSRPRALRNAQQRYVDFCLSLFRQIERARREFLRGGR